MYASLFCPPEADKNCRAPCIQPFLSSLQSKCFSATWQRSYPLHKKNILDFLDRPQNFLQLFIIFNFNGEV
jgi:hypothetical protein